MLKVKKVTSPVRKEDNSWSNKISGIIDIQQNLAGRANGKIKYVTEQKVYECENCGTSDTMDTPTKLIDGYSKMIKNPEISYSKYLPEKSTNQNCEEFNGTDTQYDLSSFPRGVVIIFNMRQFDSSTGLQDYPRLGTDKDASNVKNTFVELGFVVLRYDDVTRKELVSILDDTAKNYSSLSCFTCVILSHGLEGRFYAYDGVVNLTEAFSTLQRPYWVGKPKLFFIQACQGDSYMDSIEPDGLDKVDNSFAKRSDILIPLPSQSDFFYAYSTPPGYSSWRSITNGSWFIQELCTNIQKYARDLDLGRIMTRMNAAIALRVTNTGHVETDGKRQIASIVSQLRKDLYFCSSNFPNIIKIDRNSDSTV